MNYSVAMIHQELNPILDMSVYENIFVGRELRKNGLVDAKAEIAEAEKLIKSAVCTFPRRKSCATSPLHSAN